MRRDRLTSGMGLLRRRIPEEAPAAVRARAAAVACVAEPLEERLLMALARASGGSGYSGQLSNNAALRRQQLTCDPDEPQRGSTSVLYDSKLVTLSGIVPGPGYNNQGLNGLVEV